ncbi:putative NAD kinase, ENTH domain, NAD kinase/diacylglycerol kinase-like domain superfamily [Plasmopara halstedii]
MPVRCTVSYISSSSKRMDRLAEATNQYEDSVPLVLMKEIADSTMVDNCDAEKVVDYLLERLDENNYNIKLNSLQIILFCIQEGSPAFTNAIKKVEQKIAAISQFSSSHELMCGDEIYRRIRLASQEVLVCLNKKLLSVPPLQVQKLYDGAANSRQLLQEDNTMCHKEKSEQHYSMIGGTEKVSSHSATYHDNLLDGYQGTSICSSDETSKDSLDGCSQITILNASFNSHKDDYDSQDTDRLSHAESNDCKSHQISAHGLSQQPEKVLHSVPSLVSTSPSSKSSDTGAWDSAKDVNELRKDEEPSPAIIDSNYRRQQQHLKPCPARSSYCAASGDGYAIENDLLGMEERLKRILTFCEYQRENPLRLQDKIHDLQEQLRQAIAEKNYWMKRCKELTTHHPPTAEVTKVDLQCAKSRPRQRSNSELILIADTCTQSDHGSIFSEGSSTFEDSGALSNCKKEHANDFAVQRSIFRLLQCSDEQCEVFMPMNRSIRTQHRSRNNVQLMWDEPPRTVLVVKKPNESETTDMLVRLTSWLSKEKKMEVVLEQSVFEELALPHTKTWGSKPQDWTECQNRIDFVISLGGDGTVLWVSSLFSKSVPPVFSLAMGSLGFLTPFDAENAVEHLTSVINGGFYMSLRSRLSCTIYRGDKERAITGNLHALNEIVIDRGPSGALVELNCYCDGLEVTKIAADGIIIATPTGSTAYSLSAGGSMAHPSVPSMLFTPICPHTLSFRPLIFHDSATLKIEFPSSSRASACYVSFDGKDRVRLERGDSIIVRVSSYPLPSICRANENQDWFESMITNLNWNQRRAQKPWQPAVTSKM